MGIKVNIIENFKKGDIMSNTEEPINSGQITENFKKKGDIMSKTEEPINSGQITSKICSVHQEIDILAMRIDTLLDRLSPILSPSSPIDDNPSLLSSLVPIAMDIQKIELRVNIMSANLEHLIARIEI